MSRFKIVTSTCITHTDEHITAFCKIHCKTLCLKCVLKDHAKCVADQCVDEVKATIEESERRLPNMISSSEHLTVVLNDCKSRNEESMAILEKSEEGMNAGIVKLKISLIEQIEKLASDSLEMVKSIVTEQRRVIQHDRDVIGGFMEELNEIRSFNDEINSGQSVPVGKVKAMMEKFTVLETQFNARDRSDRNMKLAFKMSEEVDYMRTHLLSFGELCFQDSNESTVNEHVVQYKKDVQLGSDSSVKESDDFVFMLPSAHSDNSLNHGYAGLDYETLPPPLPSSHPPVGSILNKIHERHEHTTRAESMPTPLSFEHAEDGRRPLTISSPREEADKRTLPMAMPPLPRRRVSHIKRASLLAETDGEKVGSITRLNQSTDSFNSETSSLESITKPADHVDGGADNTSQSSTASLRDNEFNNVSRSTTGHGMNKSQNDVHTVRWQTGSFSSTDSQSQDTLNYMTSKPPKSHKANSQSQNYMNLKPPKSHTFMWSSSGGTTSSHTRDSGIHVSNTDISRTPNQSPTSSKKELSDLNKTKDGAGMANPTYELQKNLEPILDSDEPLKSLSQSDLPNLQELKFQKKLARTASDKSINWDTYGEEKDDIEFQKHLPSSSESSSHSDINYSRIGGGSSEDSTGSDTHLHNMKISDISQDTRRSTLHEHPDPSSTHSSGSVLNLLKPFVVKERRSDQSRNFKLPDIKDVAGHSGHHHHCTLTGIAITGAGHLLVCDFENNSVQHFNSSGVLVSDCSVVEPFSCCLMKDQLVAVTSKSRKSLSIFELSETSMSLRKEQKVGLVTEVYGVGYSAGFFAVCCRDQVTILTDDLQPYCEVKPLMITHKKSKPYFSDVRYVVMETHIKILLYVSEHNVNRITSLSLDKTFKFHKEWECRVAKPRSLVIADECLLVAAKGKIVVLSCSTGERMREIQNDVPSHPVHMVLHNHWLYMSKSSTSNSESRMLRKIHLQN